MKPTPGILAQSFRRPGRTFILGALHDPQFATMLRPRRPLLSTALAAIASIAVVCCFAATSQAGCGDYTHISQQSVKQVAKPTAVEPDSGKPCPCHGPECSGRSSIPPSAPSNTIPSFDQDATFSVGDLTSIQGGAMSALEEGLNLPSEFSLCIFRPPRS